MNYKKIIQYLKYELKGFFNYFFYKSRISVDIQSHVYASSYIKNPPIKYSSHSISNINHFINRLPKSLHKYFIVESEHPLSLTGYSRNYKISLSKINYVSSYLESDKCLKIIAPSFGWKREAKKYFNNYNNFSTKIEINSSDLSEAIEDCAIVADSCSFEAEPNKFSIYAKGSLNSANLAYSSDEVYIESPGKSRGKYSLEYLNKSPNEPSIIIVSA
jgi:hypothetical protein